MRFVCALLLLISPVVAAAQPRSAKDCAAIQESFAYNDCIAQFGPKAGQTMIRPDPKAVLATAPVVAPTRSEHDFGRRTRFVPSLRVAPRRVSGSIVQRRSNGRVFAEFQVGGAVARASAPTHAAPRRRALAAPRSRWAGYSRRRHHH